MGDLQTLSLSNDEAVQWNKDLLLQFQTALEKDPAADLMSMFSTSYRNAHRQAQYDQLSYAAQINLKTVNELYDRLKGEPESQRSSPLRSSARVLIAETASVVFPLSEKVISLLARYTKELDLNRSNNPQESLIEPLQKLLWDSTVLWEGHYRGVVVKCSDDVVAKVLTGNRDYTEYTSMQYLAEHAPNIPAPRPHGLIAFGPFRVIFMSYIGDTTLAEIWNTLSIKGKLSIQDQLNKIFCQLRTLRKDDGHMLGGVCGEGVKDDLVDECKLWENIFTGKQFNDLQFSARHHGSSTYVTFLRSFLANNNKTDICGSVFTHGDIRRENIMVKRDLDDIYVTGIIDWEDSGFYPEYYECTNTTKNFECDEG